jgi:lysozyme
MRISQNGVEFIKQKEGIKLTEYLDVAGKPTIGVGHLIRPGEKFPHLLTMDQVDSLLRDDLSRIEAVVNEYVEVKIDQNQFDALCSLTFNIGTSAFITSTFLKLLNEGHILKSADAMLHWDHVGKMESPGLLQRRRDEAKLFLS